MDTTKQALMAIRDNAEATLRDRIGLDPSTRIHLMNASRRAQKELDSIAEAQRLSAPPFTAGGPLSDALARFFDKYERA